MLAENAPSAEACGDAGIAFVGPPGEAIADMGDEVGARRLMLEASEPVLAGTETCLRGEPMLRRAHQIGLPLLIKAAVGGGGKGCAGGLVQRFLAFHQSRHQRIRA